ncbi:hypothetical protein [Nitrosomonas ureae]|uniref:hypothetical protein n=1 Tax=Nitrosomonas ureae TaxID=44577 RepID=UPI0015E656DA|nr:hypothetical protein [Nitrosomonas ureae]
MGKYSLDPGCAEIGGTFSLILPHNSGSFSFGDSSCIAGNGQRLQGSPGHKHPVQLASVIDEKKLNPKMQIKITPIFNTESIIILIYFLIILRNTYKLILTKQGFYQN